MRYVRTITMLLLGLFLGCSGSQEQANQPPTSATASSTDRTGDESDASQSAEEPRLIAPLKIFADGAQILSVTEQGQILGRPEREEVTPIRPIGLIEPDGSVRLTYREGVYRISDSGEVLYVAPGQSPRPQAIRVDAQGAVYYAGERYDWGPNGELQLPDQQPAHLQASGLRSEGLNGQNRRLAGMLFALTFLVVNHDSASPTGKALGTPPGTTPAVDEESEDEEQSEEVEEEPEG